MQNQDGAFFKELAEQPLPGMELQEKEAQKGYALICLHSKSV